MKRTKKSSLLTVTAAAAGLAMGATIAMAAHPPIPLYTYEEVATQFFGPADPTGPMGPLGPPAMQMPVMVDPVSKQGMPYSPKQTCTGGGLVSCHGGYAGYTKLADHAFHASLGYNEWMDNDPTGLFIGNGAPGSLVPNGTQTGLNPQKPWLQSHGHNGKW
jgi:hypothetical protein